MANIHNLTKLTNKTSRNGFDLSEKNLFTAKIGELLPVACFECIPGDSFDIDMAWFTRTRPVNTAAYTNIREYYDWYFVPTSLMWNKFNTFVTQMQDNNQKANGINDNVKLSDEHPYFTTNQIYNYLFAMRWGSQHKTNFFGYLRSELTNKLLSYLDYGDFSAFQHQTNAAPPYVNTKLNPFPLLAYQKIYQDHFRDSQWEKSYAPACNIDYMTGAIGSNSLPISDIDQSVENMFDLRYCNWHKDYFMGLLPKPQYGESTTITNIPNELYIRNSSGAEVGLKNVLTNETGYLITDQSTTAQRKWNLVTSGTSSEDLFSRFTILALRQAEAKQKWAEITQSQQQDYKSQVQAHFGVNVSDAYSDRSVYVGGLSGNLDISAVTNNNITGDAEADIAGKGEGGSSGHINYNVSTHGYLMCIYHAVPLLDYATDGIKRRNLKTVVTDYAIPEFDATGMVSVPMVELTRRNDFQGYPNSFPTGSYHLGYAPRYIDYKSSYDKVHGAFYNGGLAQWVAPISQAYIKEYIDNLGQAISSGLVNYHFMKVPPAVVNPIFGSDADSFVDTDHLLIKAVFDVKAVRNLDRNGLPY